MRIISTAMKMNAAIVTALEKINTIGPALALLSAFGGSKPLRPARIVMKPATPPALRREIVLERSNGPKMTRPLITIHPITTAKSQPAARPHHSRSSSFVQRLEIPANVNTARKKSVKKSGTAKTPYNSATARG